MTAVVRRSLALGLASLAVAVVVARQAPPDQAAAPARTEAPWQAFFDATSADADTAQLALELIAAHWRDRDAAMLLDLVRLLPASPVASPGAASRQRILTFLRRQTGQTFADDISRWRQWLWAQPVVPHPGYAAFKAELYGRIDPRFRAFFPDQAPATIRLDEVDWGGVLVNGIPPLRQPRHVEATLAPWLHDDDVVFGIELDGEARAYPQRILAWHELALDQVGGVDLTIVYCTLCGTVIPYRSTVDGRHFSFGTSGLLYRSNKLMFDDETHSLWSSMDGRPVVGSLVGTGLQLEFTSSVTTTWGEWRRTHPETTVLSLDTGFTRDYTEGAAYREYFATDRLMFEVPGQDTRLRNKQEVLVLRRELLHADTTPVALAVSLLRREPVFSFGTGDDAFVVVTSPRGAHRVYRRGRVLFAGTAPTVAPRRGELARQLLDTEGGVWNVTPDALISGSGTRLPRVPAHQAFWFAWHAQHPDTVLYR